MKEQVFQKKNINVFFKNSTVSEMKIPELHREPVSDLYLCRKITQDHKMRLQVSDNQPKGTIFTVRFNLLSSMTEPTRKSILLVEDEENLHDALRLNLELENYQVTSAYDGNEALKAISDEYFDLVILDVMLPGIDGISVAETIRFNKTRYLF